MADSFALREFLGLVLSEAPPDHSTISRTRRLIDLETHEAVFTWMLQRLADAGLVRGKTVGIDATTLEANAALRSVDWTHPHDPDAKITKMKDGRTHLAHKAEHAVDLETGAIVAVTVQGADDGDTETSIETLIGPRGLRLLRLRGEYLERPFAHLYVFYNQRRRHSTIGYVSPAAFERAAAQRESVLRVHEVLFIGARIDAQRIGVL